MEGPATPQGGRHALLYFTKDQSPVQWLRSVDVGPTGQRKTVGRAGRRQEHVQACGDDPPWGKGSRHRSPTPRRQHKSLGQYCGKCATPLGGEGSTWVCIGRSRKRGSPGYAFWEVKEEGITWVCIGRRGDHLGMHWEEKEEGITWVCIGRRGDHLGGEGITWVCIGRRGDHLGVHWEEKGSPGCALGGEGITWVPCSRIPTSHPTLPPPSPPFTFPPQHGNEVHVYGLDPAAEPKRLWDFKMHHTVLSLLLEVKEDKVRYGSCGVHVKEDKVRYGSCDVHVKEDKVRYGSCDVHVKEGKVRYGSCDVHVKEDKVRYGSCDVHVKEDKVRYGHVMCM